MANVDYFLRIDGIEGESADEKHKGEIDLESYSFGLMQVGTGGGGSGGAGQAQFDDLYFVALTSKASPKLFLGCASGKHYPEAVLTVRKSGDAPLEFFEITLKDVLISSYQNGGSEGGPPADQCSLNYGSIEVSYTPQQADGSAGDPVVGGWDVKGNLPL